MTETYLNYREIPWTVRASPSAVKAALVLSHGMTPLMVQLFREPLAISRLNLLNSLSISPRLSSGPRRKLPGSTGLCSRGESLPFCLSISLPFSFSFYGQPEHRCLIVIAVYARVGVQYAMRRTVVRVRAGEKPSFVPRRYNANRRRVVRYPPPVVSPRTGLSEKDVKRDVYPRQARRVSTAASSPFAFNLRCLYPFYRKR